MCEGGVQIRLSVFSLLYGTPATISRKPATGGMASQHLRTFERMHAKAVCVRKRVPVNKELLTGTVLVNNLFLIFNPHFFLQFYLLRFDL